jgi:transcriptional regulator with XRE-family HTH domain
MTPEQWPAAFTARVVQAMREARQAAGLTMSGLAQGCADRGYTEITEQTIKNLETGRRAGMTIADFVVLADVLGVPPVTLLFPLGASPTVEVLPGREVSAWDAVAWFTGETPLPQPASEGTPRELLDLFRAHGDLVAAATASSALAKERRREAGTTLDRARRAVLLERAAGYEEHAFEDAQDLRAYRERMRQRGLTPPGLPDELAFVDQPGGDA